MRRLAIIAAGISMLALTTASPAQARFFGVVSQVNQLAQVDPIVSPCVTPSAHLHIFFFSRGVQACSTLATMEASSTSAYGGVFAPGGQMIAMTPTQYQADTSGAWIPEMLINGARRDPVKMTEYWSNTSIHTTTFVDIPEGAQMIAADAHATAPPPEYELFWNCSQGFTATIPDSTTPPVCPNTGNHSLQAHLEFPMCWDGTGLTPSDFTNPGAPPFTEVPRFYACPTGFPKQLPHLQEIIHTGLAGDVTKTLSFSSGGWWTLHGDYWQTWTDQAQLAADEQFLRTGNLP